MKRHDPNIFQSKVLMKSQFFANDKINEFKFVLKDKKKLTNIQYIHLQGFGQNYWH
jgi:hypothetical protein